MERCCSRLLRHYSRIRPMRDFTAPPGHLLLAAVLSIRVSVVFVFLFVTKRAETSERKTPEALPEGFVLRDQESVGMLPENILFKRSMAKLEKIVILWKGFVTYAKGSTRKENTALRSGTLFFPPTGFAEHSCCFGALKGSFSPAPNPFRRRDAGKPWLAAGPGGVLASRSAAQPLQGRPYPRGLGDRRP